MKKFIIERYKSIEKNISNRKFKHPQSQHLNIFNKKMTRKTTKQKKMNKLKILETTFFEGIYL